MTPHIDSEAVRQNRQERRLMLRPDADVLRFVSAGTSTQVVQRFLNWNEESKGLTMVKIVCGVLVILGGVWLIYTAP
ncbi:MAG TPA: hypothetical protein VF437_08035 [Verrucomicrobiae bacterium]